MVRPQTRRLVVILHADVFGSTALAQRNEAVSHERIQDLFRRLSGTVRRYGGVAREVRGDAFVAEFQRASEAVCAAYDFQKANAEFNATINDSIAPAARIGIAVGEMLARRGAMTGTGVILAQRAEQQADPGTVCITAAVHEALPHDLGFEQKGLGEKVLKGFDEPVRLYLIEPKPGDSIPLAAGAHRKPLTIPRGAALTIAALVAIGTGVVFLLNYGHREPQTTKPVVEAGQIIDDKLSGAPLIDSQPNGEFSSDHRLGQGSVPVVSVHPFDVLGDDPEQQYLARGLTADLIAQLSRLPGLHVTTAALIPAPVAAADHKSEKDLYAIWGGVRRDGKLLEIEVSLVESQSGRQLWVQRFARPFHDIFEIQREIGTQLAQALSLRLNETELKRISHRYTTSVDAYDLFLKAQSELLVRSASSNERARDFYLQAIALDPAFARAYGGLALIYAGSYRNQWAGSSKHNLDQALKYANSAKEIDPTLPEIHWVLGYVKAQQRHHREALAHLDAALALDPRFADALALKGGIKTYIGKPRETIPLLRQAMRLNPAAGYLYFMTLGRAYFFIGDYEQAIINLREAVSRNPTSLEVHIYLAASLQLGGDADEAEWQAAEVQFIKPNFTVFAMLETYPMVDGQQLAKLTSTLEKIGL
jgi:class 3 adenylate cyclase/TolB-like protein